MQLIQIFVLVVLASASATRLRKPTTVSQKPNFGQMLVGMTRKIKAGIMAGAKTSMLAAPEFSEDIFGCAHSIKQGMETLKASYTEVHMTSTLGQACEFSNVYLELGGSKQHCSMLLKSLEEEWNGEKNYHRWCRKVAASESESMAKAMEKLENDPESKKLLEKCKGQCPYIAKMVKSGAAMSELYLQMTQPPPPGTTFEDMIKMWMDMYKKIEMHAGTICDHHDKMQCTLKNMDASCDAMLEKVMLPRPTLEYLFGMCTAAKPCKKVCNGVTEKLSDFETKQWVSLLSGGGSSEEQLELCTSFQRVDECFEKDECKNYMTHFSYTKNRMDQRCEVVQDPCFAKVAKSCKTQSDAFFGKSGASWDTSTCTDKFLPWASTPEKEVKSCCDTFSGLTQCAKDLECESNLKKFLKVTPSANWPQGRRVECHCPTTWVKAFGGVACAKP